MDYDKEIKRMENEIKDFEAKIRNLNHAIESLHFQKAGIERGDLVRCARTGTLFYAESVNYKWFKGPKQKVDGVKSKHTLSAYDGIEKL